MAEDQHVGSHPRCHLGNYPHRSWPFTNLHNHTMGEGMNLIEAVKSGRPFRRSNAIYWRVIVDGKIKFLDGEQGEDASISSADWLIATDYELKPERYQVECEWKTNNFIVYPSAPYKSSFDWDLLKGKRTKVIIEVLP